MKTMYPPRYYHNGFVASHALGQAHDIWLHAAGANDPKNAQQAKQGVWYK